MRSRSWASSTRAVAGPPAARRSTVEAEAVLTPPPDRVVCRQATAASGRLDQQRSRVGHFPALMTRISGQLPRHTRRDVPTAARLPDVSGHLRRSSARFCKGGLQRIEHARGIEAECVGSLVPANRGRSRTRPVDGVRTLC
jgi:hypothetical protein